MSELNPKWFHPGPDGKSPFTKIWDEEYRKPGIFTGHAISAAFRALLAEDAQAAPVELSALVAAGVIDKHADEIHRLQSELHARNDEITGLRGEVEELKERIKQRRDFESQRDLEYAHWQNVEVPDMHGQIQDAEAERDELAAQLAAERARVQALCEVIHDANGVAYPFGDMQNKMTAILEGRNAHAAQGDEG